MECCGCVEKASPEVWMDDVDNATSRRERLPALFHWDWMNETEAVVEGRVVYLYTCEVSLV